MILLLPFVTFQDIKLSSMASKCIMGQKTTPAPQHWPVVLKGSLGFTEIGFPIQKMIDDMRLRVENETNLSWSHFPDIPFCYDHPNPT